MSEEYVRPKAQEIFQKNDATKRTLVSLRKTMESKGIDYHQVWNSIRDTCSKTM
jgi:hypothetical protein